MQSRRGTSDIVNQSAVGALLLTCCLTAATNTTFGQSTSTYTTDVTDNWSTAGKWDIFPTSDPLTTLTFAITTSATVNLTQDISDPFVLNKMAIISSTTGTVNFGGGQLIFAETGAQLSSNVTSTKTVVIGNEILIGGSALAILSQAAGTGTAGSALVITGTVSTSNSGLTTLTLGGGATSSLNRVAGVITDGVNGGQIGIFKTGAGSWTVSNNANSFSGGITIEQGAFFYDTLSDLGDPSAQITLGTAANQSGSLGYLGTASITFTRDLHLAGTGVMTFGANATHSTATGPVTVSNTLIYDDSSFKRFRLVGAGLDPDAIHDFQSLLTNPVDTTLGLYKSGNGTWLVSNTANDFTGGITLQAGHLRFTDSGALNLGLNNLTFTAVGAATGTSSTLQTAGSLTNSLGTGAGQFQFLGGGGFAAVDGDLHITLNNDPNTPIIWGGAQGATKFGTLTELNLSATNANGVTYFHNALELTGSTNATRTHRINVIENVLTNNEFAVMTGTISGTGGITKTGTGMVKFTGENSFTGGITILAGVLEGADAALNLNLPAQALRFQGTNNGTAGIIQAAGAINFNGLGTGAGQVSWLNNGSGGFAAVGGALTVSITTGDIPIWGTGPFLAGASELVLSSTTADNVVTWSTGIDLGGAARTIRILDNNVFSLTGDYAVISGPISNGGITKTGRGMLELSGANTFVGGIRIGASVVRGVDPTLNLNITDSVAGNYVRFTGFHTVIPVLETSGTLTNSLGVGPGQIEWGPIGTVNATTAASGGFAAFGGALDIALNGGGTLTWASTPSFVDNGAHLIFGSIYANNVVTFNNNIDLNGATRVIRLVDNTDSENDFTVIAGVITDTAGGLTITGTGRLVLAQDNLYPGVTTVPLGATLQLGNGGSTGSVAGNITNVGSVVFDYGAGTVNQLAIIITGTGGVGIDSDPTGGVQLNTVQTYTGGTTVTQGILRYGAANAVPVGTVFAVNTGGTIDLNGFNAGMTTLSDGIGGGGLITNNGPADSLLSLTRGAFSGVIADGATNALAIQKFSANLLALTGSNDYGGGTTLSGGTILIGSEQSLGTGTIALVNGTLDTGVGDRTFNVPLIVAGTGTSNVTLTGDGSITFTNITNPVVSSSNALTLTLNHTGTTTFSALSIVRPTTIAGPSALTVDGDMGIANAVTFAGSSPVVVTGATNMTATTSINSLNQAGVTFNDFNLTGQLTVNGDTPIKILGTLTNNAGNRTLTLRTTGTTTLHDIRLTESTTSRTLTIWMGDDNHLVIDGAISTQNTNTGGLTLTGSPTEAPGNTVQFTGISPLTRTLVIGGNGRTYTVKSGATFPMTLNAFGGQNNTFVVESGASVGNMSFRLTPVGSIVEMFGTMTNGTVSLTGAGSRFTVHTGASMGNGAITLVDDNTFEIQAGATVGNGSITALGTATVTINGVKGTGNGSLDTGAILTGAGQSSGTWTMAAGSSVFVGGLNTVGTLTLGGLILNGGTIRFDLGALSDQLRVGVTPVINDQATLNIADSGGFGIGDYTLITGYSGTIANINRFNVITPVGFKNSLESVSGSLILHILAATTKTWTGIGNVWDDNITANFTDGSTAVTYNNTDADAVVFGDGAAVSDVVISNGGSGLAPTSVLVDNSVTTYTFSGDPITGGAQLSKRGDGLLVVLNNNTFTGGIQVSGGSVQLGNGGTTGQFDQTSIVSLNNDASLIVNRSDIVTMSGNIAGTGSVIMNGTGTLQLGGLNSYRNGTIANAGTIELVGAGIMNELGGWTANPGGLIAVLSSTNQSVDEINAAGGQINVNLSAASRVVTATSVNVTNGGTITIDNGSLSVRSLNLASGTINMSNTTAATLSTILTSTLGGGLGETAVINLAAMTTLSLGNTLVYAANNDPLTDPNGAHIAGAGNITMTTTRTFLINDSANAENDLTISANFSGTGAFAKTGAGTLYLQGAFTSTAGNFMNGGAIKIGNDLALGSATFTVTSGMLLGDGTARTLNNNINVRGGLTVTGTSALSFAQLSSIGNQTTTFHTAAKTTITNYIVADGNQARTLTIRGTGEVDFVMLSAGTGTGNDNVSFDSLDGGGIYNLLGANTYSGITSIRSGEIRVFNDAAFGLSSRVDLGVATALTRTATLLLDGGLTLTNDLHVSNTVTAGNIITIGGLTAVSSTFAGNLTLSQNVNLFSTTGATQFFTGGISNGSALGGFTVTGGGTINIAGNNAMTGVARVAQGTLLAGSATALSAAGTLQVDADGTFDLNGFSQSVGTLTDGPTGGGNIVNGGATAVFSVGAGAFSGTIGGGANVEVVKNTTGTLSLGGTNTYTGITTVADGVLLVNGSLAGSVNVDAAGTLGGIGSIAGTVTSLGTISPGTSPGTLTVGQLVLGGGAVNFELDTIGNSDRIVLSGGAAPVVNGTTTLNFAPTINFDEGTYTLMSGYAGFTIDGGQIGSLSAPTTVSGLQAALQNIDGQLNLVVSTTHLTWTGAATAAWNSADVNWNDDGTLLDTAFNSMSVVAFGSSAVTNVVVDAAGVTPHHMLVDTTTHNYTFSGGAIVGTSLTLTGPGVLSLQNDNTYVRGVTLNNGELVVGDGTTNGGLVGDILNNALLTFNRSDVYTYAGDISGTGALRQNGTGTLILTGDNTFTGPTTINFGFLEVQGNFASTIFNETGNQITVASNTTGTVAFTAPIVGNVSFEQNGSGVTTLSGASTYTGGTEVNAGTLIVADSLNGTEQVDVNSSATLQVVDGASITTPGEITVVGTADFTNPANVPGTLVVNGTVNAPSGVTVGQGGVVQGNGTVNGPLVIGDGGALSPGNSVGAIGGTNLTLTGGSTLVFEFRDAAGTVDFNGGDPGGTGAGFGWDLIDLGSGLIDLGDASASDPIFIRVDAWALDNSAHDAGSGGAIFDPNSSYEWLFVKTDGTPLPDFDFPPDDDLSRRFVVIDDANNLGVFGTNNAFTRPSSSVGQGTFRVAFGNYGGQGNGLYITYSAIPEPGSVILAGLASLGAGWYGRRRTRKKDESASVAA